MNEQAGEPQEGGVSWRLIAFVAVAIVVFTIGKRLLPDLSLQQAVNDVSRTLGDWTYLLVGALAFGETGAFIGLFLPGEFAVILGGAVAGQGEISLPLVLGVAWLSAFLGDTTGFYVGRRVGRGFLVRHGPKVGITKARFKQVEDYFAEHGGATILVGRFISFVRPLAPFLASGSGMRYRDFAPYSVLGTGLWAGAFVLLGYFGSRSLDHVAELASRGSFVLGTILAVLAAIWLTVRFLRRAENRKNAVAWMERHAATRPLLVAGRRFRGPARFAWARVTPGPLGLELTTLLAVLSVALFVLIAYWSVVGGDPDSTRGDRTAFDFAHDIQAGWLTAFAKAVTHLGAAYVTLPLAVAAAIVLAVRSRWAEFWVLVAGMTLIVVVTADIKHIVDRPRPGDGLVDAAGSSFPSAHAAYATLYGWLGATLSLRLGPRSKGGTALIVGGLIVTALIGLTRVYLHVHYLSDVLAGWALGAACFSLCAVVALLTVRLRSTAESPVDASRGDNQAP